MSIPKKGDELTFMHGSVQKAAVVRGWYWDWKDELSLILMIPGEAACYIRPASSFALYRSTKEPIKLAKPEGQQQ